MLKSQNCDKDFRQYWEDSLIRSQLPIAQHEHLYRLLSRAYSEPQRYYHTQQHIVECLSLFHEIKQCLNDSLAVETALWFHDVIYDPQASDNELQSAELMQQICQHFLSSTQLEKVYTWILATQRHTPSEDDDLNYLLDIDLAILGSSSNRFEEYEKQIKFEYAWVEPNVYQIKRFDVLNYFYQMNPIYQTCYLQNRFEMRAKDNLAKRIINL